MLQKQHAIFFTALVIATLLGGALRLHGLGDGGIWIDELYTVRDTGEKLKSASPTRIIGYLPTRWVLAAKGISVDDIRTFDTQEQNGQTLTFSNPNYEHYKDAGITPATMRLAACLIGIFTIPVIGIFARRPFGTTTAVMLMILIAFSPWHIAWSQLARFYTQLFLFYSLAAILYYEYTRYGVHKNSPSDKTRFVIAMIAMLGCHLTHPPALCVAFIFGIDYLLGLTRAFILKDPQQRVLLGKFGWTVGLVTIALSVLVIIFENLPSLGGTGRGYDKFVGAQANSAQSPAVIIFNTFIMVGPTVLILTALGVILAWRPHAKLQLDQHNLPTWRTAVYFALTALVPLSIIAAISATGGFGHSRYTFVGLIGYLVLAAIAAATLFHKIQHALTDRKPLLRNLTAAAPTAIAIAALLTMIGSYHTSGHHLRQPWHLAFSYVNQHRNNREDILCGRPQIARYYTGTEYENVHPIPGVTDALRNTTQDGTPVWIVRLSATSLNTLPWKCEGAPGLELKKVFPIRSWLPYRELSVFYYDPANDPGHPTRNVAAFILPAS